MKRINRADAIAVAEALVYDPSCDRCIQITEGPHNDDCATKARDRILAASEED